MTIEFQDSPPQVISVRQAGALGGKAAAKRMTPAQRRARASRAGKAQSTEARRQAARKGWIKRKTSKDVRKV